MDKVIEERDEGYVLIYRRGREEAREWGWLDKNKNQCGRQIGRRWRRRRRWRCFPT